MEIIYHSARLYNKTLLVLSFPCQIANERHKRHTLHEISKANFDTETTVLVLLYKQVAHLFCRHEAISLFNLKVSRFRRKAGPERSLTFDNVLLP